MNGEKHMSMTVMDKLKNARRFYQFPITGFPAPLFVQVHNKQGTRTVEPRIKGVDGRAKNDSGNKTRNYRRQYIAYQF